MKFVFSEFSYCPPNIEQNYNIYISIKTSDMDNDFLLRALNTLQFLIEKHIPPSFTLGAH